MRQHWRTVVTFLVVFALAGIIPSVLLITAGIGEAGVLDSTGTLAGAYNADTEDESAAQTAEAGETEEPIIRPGPSNHPMPGLTGVPTPWPTDNLPIPTAPPTIRPEIWNNCPAFTYPAPFSTPAPGELTCPPTPLPTVLPPTLGPDDPFHIWTYHERSLDQDSIAVPIETRGSELVVIGTVQQVHAPRWTTADGRRPANPNGQSDRDPDYKIIVTPVELAVEQYLKGSGPPRLNIWSWGGTIGRDVVEVLNSEVYAFKAGQRVVMFLEQRKHASGDEPVWDVVARYTIVGDEARLDHIRIPLPQLLEWIRASAEK